MRNEERGSKLHWLLAVVTLGVAILVTLVLPELVGPLPRRAIAVIHGAVFGVGAAAAAVVTRANVLAVLHPFIVASVGLAVFHFIYFIVIGRVAVSASVFGTPFSLLLWMEASAIFLSAGLVGSVVGAIVGALLDRKLPAKR